MEELIAIAERIGARLKQRGDTIAVAESSTGGLISAALLAVPGASAYFIGGGVIYTGKARAALLGLTPTCPTACDPPPSRMPRCWRAPCARPAAPLGNSPKLARQAPPATATVTRRDTVASRSQVRRNMPLRSKRGNRIGRRICTPSPLGH